MRVSDGDKDVLLLLMASTLLGGKGGFILPSSCVVELSPSSKRLGLYGLSSSTILLSHRSLKFNKCIIDIEWALIEKIKILIFDYISIFAIF